MWLYRGLNLSCQFDLPSHLVSGFSTQLTVNISPFCPRLFILRTYLTMTRIPPCYSDRASRDRGMSRQKQAQTLELSEARDTLCAVHPPCLCCIKWGQIMKSMHTISLFSSASGYPAPRALGNYNTFIFAIKLKCPMD